MRDGLLNLPLDRNSEPTHCIPGANDAHQQHERPSHSRLAPACPWGRADAALLAPHRRQRRADRRTTRPRKCVCLGEDQWCCTSATGRAGRSGAVSVAVLRASRKANLILRPSPEENGQAAAPITDLDIQRAPADVRRSGRCGGRRARSRKEQGPHQGWVRGRGEGMDVGPCVHGAVPRRVTSTLGPVPWDERGARSTYATVLPCNWLQ